MPKKPANSSVSKPPYLGLDEALRAIEAIQEQGGGSLSFDSLSGVLNNSTKSSSFRLKVNALRNYGLVDENKNRVLLTKTAMGVVAPTDADERWVSATNALRNIPLAKVLHDRYAGGTLPPPEALANVLLREYGAPAPLNQQWAQFFLDSVRVAGLVSSAGGRTTLRSAPDQALSSATDQATVEVPEVSAPPRASRIEPEVAAGLKGDYQRIEMVLASGGKAHILLPTTANADDVGDVIDMLEVMRKRAERSAGVRQPGTT